MKLGLLCSKTESSLNFLTQPVWCVLFVALRLLNSQVCVT